MLGQGYVESSTCQTDTISHTSGVNLPTEVQLNVPYYVYQDDGGYRARIHTDECVFYLRRTRKERPTYRWVGPTEELHKAQDIVDEWLERRKARMRTVAVVEVGKCQLCIGGD